MWHAGLGEKGKYKEPEGLAGWYYYNASYGRVLMVSTMRLNPWSSQVMYILFFIWPGLMHLHKPSSKTIVIDVGKRAWKPAYFESSYLLFMSANDFITGRSLTLPTCQFCYWPNYHQPIMLKIRLAWLWWPRVWHVLPWLRVIWLVDLTCETSWTRFLHATFQTNRTGERKMIMNK